LSRVTQQLDSVRKTPQFLDIPYGKQDELVILFEIVKEQDKTDPFKENALIFLVELYAYHDFLEAYDQSILFVINKIKEDMIDLDYVFERQFVALKTELDNHPIAKLDRNNLSEENKLLLTDYESLEQKINQSLERLATHRWMESKFDDYEGMQSVKEPDVLLAEFMLKEKQKAFKLYDENEDIKKIRLYLETQIIDFYYKKSLRKIDPNNFELRYLLKKE
jgi:hypothetical protein